MDARLSLRQQRTPGILRSKGANSVWSLLFLLVSHLLPRCTEVTYRLQSTPVTKNRIRPFAVPDSRLWMRL